MNRAIGFIVIHTSFKEQNSKISKKSKNKKKQKQGGGEKSGKQEEEEEGRKKASPFVNAGEKKNISQP